MQTRSTFTASFIVRAPQEAVAAFHHETVALRRLTPPPIIVQLHSVEPLAEGSISIFTLWFGPFPVHWSALHSGVDPARGFTDTQRAGPMAFWQHRHTFEALDQNTTQVHEHIEYAHHTGWRGLLSRVLFNPPALRLLFAYRCAVTRRVLERRWRS